jgi:hypothetical protein
MSITEFLDSVEIAHFTSPEEFWERLHGLPNKDTAVIARTIFEERQSGRVNPVHSAFFFESLEKVISVEDMQKIMDANEKIVKKLKENEK